MAAPYVINDGDRTDDAPGESWRDFVHSGPGTLAGRWLRTFWHPVLRSVDLPTGQAKPIEIMSEQFTLYRGEGGDPHLLAFRCAHRGTQLSTGWVEGDTLRCFYHGWRYDGTGQCVEQPAEPEPFCQRIKIRSYPVQEYLGLIFAYLGEGEAPDLPRYPEFEDETRGFNDVTAGSTPCNLFNMIDNDPIHIYFVHRTFNAAQGRADIPSLRCEETEYGFVTWASDSEESWAYHLHAPNVVHGRSDGFPKGEALQFRVPRNDESTISFRVYLIYSDGPGAEQYRQTRAGRPNPARALVHEVGQQVLRGELRVQDVDDMRILFNLQDYVAVVGQGTITDLRAQHLGHSDAPITMLRALWGKELKALAEGRPLTRWRRSAEPMVLSVARNEAPSES